MNLTQYGEKMEMCQDFLQQNGDTSIITRKVYDFLYTRKNRANKNPFEINELRTWHASCIVSGATRCASRVVPAALMVAGKSALTRPREGWPSLTDRWDTLTLGVHNGKGTL